MKTKTMYSMFFSLLLVRSRLLLLLLLILYTYLFKIHTQQSIKATSQALNSSIVLSTSDRTVRTLAVSSDLGTVDVLARSGWKSHEGANGGDQRERTGSESVLIEADEGVRRETRNDS